MHQLNSTRLAVLLAAGSLVGLSGCYQSTAETTDSIAAALEEENGGFDEQAELPAFGLEAELEEDARLEEDVEVSDPTEETEEVRALRDAPDTAVFNVHLEWGQFPFNRDAAPYNWSGRFAVNRGAIVVRRTSRFELLDRLAPREDPRVLDFRSVTLPHHDGVVISVIDPTPRADEPLVLRYVRAADARDGRIDELTEVPLARLVDEPRVVRDDEAGNRMVAGARVELLDRCQHGMIGGRWHRLADGRGRFLGRATGERGQVVGHVRGIYGERRDGSRVFFGKIINREGETIALMGGTYGEGELEGRLIHRSSELGAVGGRYIESIPGPEVGGHFLMRWAETTCDR